MFYKRLFETAPELKALFKGDMQQQGKRLMSMIGVAVGKLNDLPDWRRPCTTLAGVTPVTASSRKIMRRWAARCYGRSNRVSAPLLPTKSGRPGLRSMACSPTP